MKRNGFPVVFAVTVFTSAFLLFQVQPLLGKFILPWFGGSPAVWTTCMLVFQVLLFAGYAYAHFLTQRLTLSRQTYVHAALLVFAALTLPIVPDAVWKPTGSESPTWRIVLLLLTTVGLPYFLLSATGPLLQRWFVTAYPGTSPYRLYALSNIGSLLALLTFPFLVEPVLSSTQQARFWSLVFCGFAVLCLGCGWRAARLEAAGTTNRSRGPDRSPPIPAAMYLSWFLLAMIPSIMLLATTNQVCLDIAVIPFLWILPLTIYLLSFIVTFDSDRWYRPRPTIILCSISLAATSLVASQGVALPLLFQISVFFVNLFLVCLLCHGELVRRKPVPQRLTSFYLTISAGGAAGGLFVGLAAPRLFHGYHELNLGMLAAVLVCLAHYLQHDRRWRESVPGWLKASLAAGITGLALIYFTAWAGRETGTLALERNFYGVLRVRDVRDESSGKPVRKLVHGRIIHGCQFQNAEDTHRATTYFSPDSGAGRTLTRFAADRPRRIGVVGLGAGTLAAYGRDTDQMRFYEINPLVESMAREYFTFLSDTPADVDVILGDARLTLENEPPQEFDVLVLDAFSGDAIPVHLLTAEAMRTYTRHLAPGGLMVVHISNLHFDLEPVIRGLAREFGFVTRKHLSDPQADPGAMESRWMVLARDDAALTEVLGPGNRVPKSERLILWTDDRSNLLQVLH